MGFIESELFKGKYFEDKSRDKIRASTAILLIFVTIFITIFSLFNDNVSLEIIIFINIAIVLLLLAFYLIFPRLISVSQMSYMILSSLTFILTLSFVSDYNQAEIGLFGLASLPAFSFFFLGAKAGIRWNSNMFMLLLLIPAFSFFTKTELAYSYMVLLQVIIGYMVVSYILYIIEKERSENEKKLSVALKENKILFKEVHHRTRNNMQVIMGLLETQSFKIDDPKYKKIFESHVDRLKAMSLMHKNLYTYHSYEYVEVDKYLIDIGNSLQSYTLHKLDMQMDTFLVHMKDALSIGLIFNEAINNSIDHAFEDCEEVGKIEVVLKKENNRCTLTVKDNGKGFDVSKKYNKSLGITLMEDLSRSLPMGDIEFIGELDMCVKISFDIRESP